MSSFSQAVQAANADLQADPATTASLSAFAASVSAWIDHVDPSGAPPAPSWAPQLPLLLGWVPT